MYKGKERYNKGNTQKHDNSEIKIPSMSQLQNFLRKDKFSWSTSQKFIMGTNMWNYEYLFVIWTRHEVQDFLECFGKYVIKQKSQLRYKRLFLTFKTNPLML